MKFLVILAFVAILGSLAAAWVYVLRDAREGQSKSSRMVWALTLRVGFSIVLFLGVLLAWKLGYIEPNRVAF